MKNGILDKVLKEIFPKKLSRLESSDEVYAQLKMMILSGKVKNGQRLLREEFAHLFDVNPIFGIIFGAINDHKEDGFKAGRDRRAGNIPQE